MQYIYKMTNDIDDGDIAIEENGSKIIITDEFSSQFLQNCILDFQESLAGGFFRIENPKAKNQDFNIANPSPIAMIDLAKLLWKLTKQKKPFKVKYISGFKFDIKKRIPDTTRIENLLGWKAKVPFERGLLEVVGWLQSKI